jgi:hypothetical protein
MARVLCRGGAFSRLRLGVGGLERDRRHKSASSHSGATHKRSQANVYRY